MHNPPVFLAGLPRSGSTLLTNLLGQHPEITVGPSSPICHVLNNMRKTWSDDPFLLAQLENFDEVYKKLEDSTKAFLNTWCKADTAISIDKSRGWLAMSETLLSLYQENFKIVVTLRDLEQIFGSVEKQHRKTLLLDFPDHMEHHIIDSRANALFQDGGVVGGPLRSLNNLMDAPHLMRHICFVRFEDLTQKPNEVCNQVAQWMRLEGYKFNVNDVKQLTHEYDGFYRMKYTHKVNTVVKQPEEYPIPERIAQEIHERFSWYYQRFYQQRDQQPKNDGVEDLNTKIAQEIEEALS